MRQSTWGVVGRVLVVALLAAPAIADEVVLRGGGRLTGVIVEQTPTRITLETGPGRVTLPMSRVERVVGGPTALEAFAERAAALSAGEVDGWAALARWADDRLLLTQARLAWERVLAADPLHPEANAALGRVEVDGLFLPRDDAYRARGFVSFEGRWLTPAEHEAAVRERTADEAAALATREAGMRVREAEARAREAEARAEEAEASAQAASAGGIPLGWGSGYGYGYGWGGGVVVGPGVPGYRPAGHGRGGYRSRQEGPHTDGWRRSDRDGPHPAPAPRPRPSTGASLMPTERAPQRPASRGAAVPAGRLASRD